jgi:hypothetical protein
MFYNNLRIKLEREREPLKRFLNFFTYFINFPRPVAPLYFHCKKVKNVF